MLNIISIVIGIIGAVLAIVGFIPLLGWTNWVFIIVPIIGAVVGLLSRQKAGRNLNFFVMAVMALRLVLGGGII